MQTRNVAKAKVAPSQPSERLRSRSHPSQNTILTGKELNVLELVSYGYDNGAIADHFHTTLQAVKNMMRVIHLKLGADNRAHAVAVCFRNGWFAESGNGGAGSAPSPTRESMFDEASTQIAKLYTLSAPQPRDGRETIHSAKFGR